MADVAEKEKAEKLAAAKKRFEQIKKQKGKAKPLGDKKKDDEKAVAAPSESSTALDSETATLVGDNDSIQDGGEPATNQPSPQKDVEPPQRSSHTRQPSLSIQSKMRSSSFRQNSVSQTTPASPTSNASKAAYLPPLSPDVDSVTEVYRKQAARLEELEKENKRLAKEARESEGRWRKTEEELEDLREASGEVAELKSRAATADAKAEEVNRLTTEITSLNRQLSTLQSQTSRPRQTSSSQPPRTSSPDSLSAQLASKSSTIESMELEISNLRAQLTQRTSSSSSTSEQVSALETKLSRAETAAGAAQRQLADTKKALERLSEKAVKEGSERISTETKISSLSREAEESKKSAEESLKRVETLEKKLATLTLLHREADTRRRESEREKERTDKEIADLRRKTAGFENETARLREEAARARMRRVDGGANDGLDELEDEERRKLEARVRELEGQVFDLKRGAWRERKRELQGTGAGTEHADALGSPAAGGFDDVDLSGPSSYLRRPSMKAAQAVRSGGLVNALSSGFSAFTSGGGGGVGGGGGGERERERQSLEFLPDDDEAGFDEETFRRAQEEEGRERLERVREVKRGLKEWEGWRMDIVDSRAGGMGGAGEIFDV